MNIKIETFTSPYDAEQAVLHHMPDAVVAPYEQFAWTQCWHTTFGTEYLGLMILANDTPAFFCQFEVTKKNGLRIAGGIGGKHANFHVPILAKDFLGLSVADAKFLQSELVQVARHYKIDAFDFERQLEVYQNIQNPLCIMGLPMVREELLITRLQADYELFANEARGSSGRKRDRKQDKGLSNLGEWRCYEALSNEQRTHVLNIFFEQKNIRLNAKGISNIFADPLVQRFFTTLADHQAVVRMFALVLNGQIIATSGCITNGWHVSGMFNSMDQTLHDQVHPGMTLQRFEVKTLCESQAELYDLGAGDARYKRSWLKDTCNMYYCVLPVTMQGRVYGFCIQSIRHIKFHIKSSPKLWALAQKLRKLILMLRGQSPSEY